MWRTAFLAWPLAYGAFSGTKIEVARVSCAHPTVLDDIVGNYLAVNQPVVIEANCTSSWSGFKTKSVSDARSRSCMGISDALRARHSAGFTSLTQRGSTMPLATQATR